MAASAKPKDEVIAWLYARAREIDQAAWADRDRLEAERGVNPDLLGERPRSEAERRMRDRRGYSLTLAMDEQLTGGDPAIARALRSLHPVPVN